MILNISFFLISWHFLKANNKPVMNISTQLVLISTRHTLENVYKNDYIEQNVSWGKVLTPKISFFKDISRYASYVSCLLTFR